MEHDKELAGVKEEEDAYDGYLGEESYPLERRSSYRLVKSVVEDFCDAVVFGPALDFRRKKKEALEQQEAWQASRTMLERRAVDTARASAVRAVGTRILMEVVEEMATGIYAEHARMSGIATRLMSSIVLNAVRSLPGLPSRSIRASSWALSAG